MNKELKDNRSQIQLVSNFQELVQTPFAGDVNALCWKRNLTGDFSEIVSKLNQTGNITEIEVSDLEHLDLSPDAVLARTTLIEDINFLKSIGAQPNLNLIEYYERDELIPNFPTDVYSFHVDRSPIPVYTYLCTYHGTASDILPNHLAIQKINIPENREILLKLYNGPLEGFDNFLKDNFFDLHYQAMPDAALVNLGQGNMWRLAVDHPESNVLPCLHRAPVENAGELRLMLIC